MAFGRRSAEIQNDNYNKGQVKTCPFSGKTPKIDEQIENTIENREAGCYNKRVVK